MSVRKRNDLPQGDANSAGDKQSLSLSLEPPKLNLLANNDNYALHKQIQSYLGDTNYIYNEYAGEQFNYMSIIIFEIRISYFSLAPHHKRLVCEGWAAQNTVRAPPTHVFSNN